MSRVLAVVLLVAAVASVSAAQVGSVAAHPHGSSTYIPLGGGIAIERTELLLHVPGDGDLQWAFVEGMVADPVKGYPVIIQIHSRDGEPVRVSQVDVGDDGAYEYRFRVYSIDDGTVVRAFAGDYDVTVYKVVYINGMQNHA